MTTATASSEHISASATGDRIQVNVCADDRIAAAVSAAPSVTSLASGGMGLRGPRGERGERGEQGPQGIQGIPGPAGGIATIAEAADVFVAGVQTGDVLRFDSGLWRNYADADLTDGGNW